MTRHSFYDPHLIYNQISPIRCVTIYNIIEYNIYIYIHRLSFYYFTCSKCCLVTSFFDPRRLLKPAMPPKAAPKARQTPPPEGDTEDALGDDYDMPVIVKVRPMHTTLYR